MRATFPFLLLFPATALADQITTTSRVTGVTVYANLAEVTRSVTLDLPAGRHSLTITDLPLDTPPEGMRLTAGEGVQIGGLSLRAGRLIPDDDTPDPAAEAADAAIRAARATLADAQRAVDTIEAEVDAAEARAAFLASVTTQADASVSAEQLAALAATIGTEILAAKQAALAARAGLPEAEAIRDEAAGALQRAIDTRAALVPADREVQYLTASVEAAAAGPVTVEVTYFVEGASWRPVYDIALTRGDAPSLVIDRGALVSQATGEDWRGVNLSLSTAMLGAQTTASPLWPELRQVVEEPDPAERAAGAASDSMVMEPEIVMEPAVAAPAFAEIDDDAVTYRVPLPVDLATGAEEARIRLGSLTLAPVLEARAVPALDRTAFQIARFVNDSGELLLSGKALLTRDGVLVGGADLPRLAPGEEGELGFGAIEGLRLTAEMPRQNAGDQGLIVTSNRQETRILYRIENLTDRDWTVRMLDTVSYSEQDDLAVEVTATPEPAERDVDGLRGQWAWTLPVAAGQQATVELSEVLVWPEEMILR